MRIPSFFTRLANRAPDPHPVPGRPGVGAQPRETNGLPQRQIIQRIEEFKRTGLDRLAKVLPGIGGNAVPQRTTRPSSTSSTDSSTQSGQFALEPHAGRTWFGAGAQGSMTTRPDQPQIVEKIEKFNRTAPDRLARLFSRTRRDAGAQKLTGSSINTFSSSSASSSSASSSSASSSSASSSTQSGPVASIVEEARTGAAVLANTVGQWVVDNTDNTASGAGVPSMHHPSLSDRGLRRAQSRNDLRGEIGPEDSASQIGDQRSPSASDGQARVGVANPATPLAQSNQNNIPPRAGETSTHPSLRRLRRTQGSINDGHRLQYRDDARRPESPTSAFGGRHSGGDEAHWMPLAAALREASNGQWGNVETEEQLGEHLRNYLSGRRQPDMAYRALVARADLIAVKKPAIQAWRRKVEWSQSEERLAEALESYASGDISWEDLQNRINDLTTKMVAAGTDPEQAVERLAEQVRAFNRLTEALELHASGGISPEELVNRIRDRANKMVAAGTDPEQAVERLAGQVRAFNHRRHARDITTDGAETNVGHPATEAPAVSDIPPAVPPHSPDTVERRNRQDWRQRLAEAVDRFRNGDITEQALAQISRDLETELVAAGVNRLQAQMRLAEQIAIRARATPNRAPE
jgi:hypothetical protein